MSLQIQFFIEGDILTLTSGDGLGKVVISEAGDLAINRDRVLLQEMEREILRDFFRNSSSYTNGTIGWPILRISWREMVQISPPPPSGRLFEPSPRTRKMFW